jgi:hypothetical protein
VVPVDAAEEPLRDLNHVLCLSKNGDAPFEELTELADDALLVVEVVVDTG